jgi:hypothetical protein
VGSKRPLAPGTKEARREIATATEYAGRLAGRLKIYPGEEPTT